MTYDWLWVLVMLLCGVVFIDYARLRWMLLTMRLARTSTYDQVYAAAERYWVSYVPGGLWLLIVAALALWQCTLAIGWLVKALLS